MKSSSSVRVLYPSVDRAELVQRLKDGIERLAEVLPLRRVVLFGSWAKSRHTVGSDIDVLVIHQGEPRSDAYALAKRTLKVPRLEPHLYTEAEYEAARPTVDRMTEAGVVLFAR